MMLSCLSAGAVAYLALVAPSGLMGARSHATPAPPIPLQPAEAHARSGAMVMSATPAVLKPSPTRSRRGGQLVSWYFNTISSTRLLTAEQERTLVELIHAGDAHEA
eukprot:248642-Prymnesium_polylepis.1